jgi:hypothetical protein
LTDRAAAGRAAAPAPETKPLAGLFFHRCDLVEKQANSEPSRRRNNEVAGEEHRQQKSPSWFT